MRRTPELKLCECGYKAVLGDYSGKNNKFKYKVMCGNEKCNRESYGESKKIAACVWNYRE